MPIVTRTGDTGNTQLASGQMTEKSNPRLHAYGTVDELDALLGVMLTEKKCSENLRDRFFTIQRELYLLKADLATQSSHTQNTRLDDQVIERMEEWIEEAESKVPRLTHFIIPGGTPLAAKLHFARTVCRRAERWVVQLARCEAINQIAIRYLNRLSDYLFAVARVVNDEAGISDDMMTQK